MSTARHPRTDGLTGRVNHTMQKNNRCYCLQSGFDWTSCLRTVEFYYNYSIIDGLTHTLFDVWISTICTGESTINLN
jgi:hypothetical protein